MPTAATTAPSAGTAAHAHDAHHAPQHDAHVRLWRDSPAGRQHTAYVALRRGLDARGSLPPVEPWTTNASVWQPLQRNGIRPGVPEWFHAMDARWLQLNTPPPPSPTTGSQWCGVLHPDAPRECVVRSTDRSVLYYAGARILQYTGTRAPEWVWLDEFERDASPATPASIPHARDAGRVEWRDDPAEVWLETYRDERGVPWMLSHPPLARARLLGGTAAGDPPSPWWEGDGRGRRAAE